ncbi:adenosylcobinamide-GDP ribazoletransferase [Clostridium septicum]|uniref:Adenosylcobinamide-GDP ribazoletransferase n=1 Tax=Clostridium septicum TaxID=1504 RepID=A0A9N7JP91_CLOSE|nr:adenosylcobinamide-GDP ribazoletransferase [Clostridium septicum]AYE35257.1 adenosylcobinamide-GDP ribazoletransferase [Clostridium septicum]MDU1313680.1 adenosylcobinamide-GDP ribazoletransferase [Clostridium septicum]QAS60652.1 adenosylcobinamide-GDP ribazoletransferase [Clostridium septicum]UEC20093.1 adenosylcobinamide-GDP ribazoletransferase [Clostridium septicum]USS01851.1 adenosylcobinamide-GDP ribazoletransferase [Clostridium septicum]
MKKYFKGFLMAISMFTIIPLPYYQWDDEGAKHILKFYPFIGFVIGLIWYGIYKLTVLLGMSTMLSSAITMIIPFVITGMLHLDGYMDVCDALLSRRDKEEKIRILKDPNTGAFAVISLGILFIVDFAAIYTIVDNNINTLGFILIPIISRGLMGLLLICKNPMKESSLGAYFRKDTGKFDKLILVGILIIVSIAFYLIFNIKALIIPILMIISGLLVVRSSANELGGMSGDSAGYGLVISELIGVLFLTLI